MRIPIFTIAVLSTTLACNVWAQRAPTAAEYFQEMQQRSMTKRFSSKTFVSGGDNIGGSVIRTGSTYEISEKRYAGEPQNIQVFQPMANHLPEFLKQAMAPPAVQGLQTGINSTPRFSADSTLVVKGSSGVLPEAILADWNAMWRSVGHDETRNMWGGTITRKSNQVTYRSTNECQRGCSFSIADNPMTVAARVQTIRQYWQLQHALPLDGETAPGDPWARSAPAPQAENKWIRSIQLNPDLSSPIERTAREELTTWAK